MPKRTELSGPEGGPIELEGEVKQALEARLAEFLAKRKR
jgi:hypothetical protein